MIYIKNDLFKCIVPKTNKILTIAHVVNVQGAWGAGFVLPLAKAFPEAKEHYDLYVFLKRSIENPRRKELSMLGTIQMCPVVGKQDILVANMFAQDGFRGPGITRPVRYGHLAMAMSRVADDMLNRGHFSNLEIHCPKFGCGLGGGSWDVVKDLIEDLWEKEGIDVFVYSPD